MIDNFTFGKFIVDGETFNSNITLINDKAKKHRYLPNHELKIDDFIELVESKPDYIIIGNGASGVIQVQDEIIEYIEKHGIKIIIEKTGDACNTYNKMIKQGKKVAAFLHDTC